MFKGGVLRTSKAILDVKNYTSVEMIIIMHKYLQFFKIWLQG